MLHGVNMICHHLLEGNLFPCPDLTVQEQALPAYALPR